MAAIDFDTLVNEPAPRNLFKRSRFYVYFVAVFFGVGYMIYAGGLAALSWMPKNWTVMRDGEPEWGVHGLALFSAVFGSLLFVNKLTEYGRRLAAQDRESLERQVRGWR